MRMGRDCLVTTRCRRSQTASAGLYSQSFLRATKQREIVIPIVTWRLSDGAHMGDAEDRREALAALLEWSPFKTEKELLAHVMLSARTYIPPRQSPTDHSNPSFVFWSVRFISRLPKCPTVQSTRMPRLSLDSGV